MITQNIISASVISGELIIGLADGSIIRAGLVQGAPGSKGDPGPPGPKGADGKDGNTILNGRGRPDPALGKDGDWYIDVSLSELWGPKTGGRWLGPVPLLSQEARRDRTGRGTGLLNAGARSAGPAFFGGVSGGGVATATPQTGLLPIIGSGQPQPAGTLIKIAEDDRGTLFECEIRAESANGMWTGHVTVGQFNGAVSHSVWGDFTIGATPPTLTFTPSVVAGKLTLEMSSDLPLVRLEGVEVMLTV